MAKKKLKDTCFPVPKDFKLQPTALASLDSNGVVKNSLFQDTVRVAYHISIPYSFTSDYNGEKPYKLATEEQLQAVATLFQALSPKDAVEAALAQQFIILHLHSMNSAFSGLSEKDLKKIELSHSVLETLQKYRTKGAQQITVQYVNKGQILNQSQANIVNDKENDTETIQVEGETL